MSKFHVFTFLSLCNNLDLLAIYCMNLQFRGSNDLDVLRHVCKVNNKHRTKCVIYNKIYGGGWDWMGWDNFAIIQNDKKELYN